MSKKLKPGRTAVELRPSRIRRDPPPRPGPAEKAVTAYLEEREAWIVVVGVISFAIAFAIIIIGVSDYTSG